MPTLAVTVPASVARRDGENSGEIARPGRFLFTVSRHHVQNAIGHCSVLSRFQTLIANQQPRFKLRPMKCAEKILASDKLAPWRANVRGSGRKLIVTNGCFDVLHAGHVTYLEAARAWGDVLLVGLNGDAGVRELKGPGRPINCEADRAIVIAGLQSVDAVCVFQETSATTFLSMARPDIYVKGGDYTLDTINREERRLVEQLGGRIVILPLLPGRSTTAILERLK